MIYKINDTVTNCDTLRDGFIERDGYIFTSLTYPYNVYDAIVIRDSMQAEVDSPQYPKSQRRLEEHISLVNEYNLEKAVVIAESLEFIIQCPTIRHLQIFPSRYADESFSFAPLYELPEILSLSVQNIYGSQEQYIGEVDYSRIKGLEKLSLDADEGVLSYNLNYNKIASLKSLGVSGFKGEKRNLTDLFCSEQLDTLRMIGGRFQSLDGIERSNQMQCLYIHYNRCLEDITALGKIAKTLKALRIENCPKIKDFSVLAELENLELLELTGSNTLPDLSFVRCMRNLKTFTFSMNVLDGDLSPCMELSYVFSEKDRKHYNLKNAVLPKGKYIRGNDSIEAWRRLE